MAFRTLEISSEAEIHIKDGQLEINNKNGIALIPVEDLLLKFLCVLSQTKKPQKNTTGVLNNSHLKQEPSGFYVLPKNNIKIFIWCPVKLIIKKKQLVATVILCYNSI